VVGAGATEAGAVGTDTSACDAATARLDVDSNDQAARAAIATNVINPVTVVSNNLRIFILIPPIGVVVICRLLAPSCIRPVASI